MIVSWISQIFSLGELVPGSAVESWKQSSHSKRQLGCLRRLSSRLSMNLIFNEHISKKNNLNIYIYIYYIYIILILYSKYYVYIYICVCLFIYIYTYIIYVYVFIFIYIYTAASIASQSETENSKFNILDEFFAHIDSHHCSSTRQDLCAFLGAAWHIPWR